MLFNVLLFVIFIVLRILVSAIRRLGFFRSNPVVSRSTYRVIFLRSRGVFSKARYAQIVLPFWILSTRCCL